MIWNCSFLYKLTEWIKVYNKYMCYHKVILKNTILINQTLIKKKRKKEGGVVWGGGGGLIDCKTLRLHFRLWVAVSQCIVNFTFFATRYSLLTCFPTSKVNKGDGSVPGVDVHLSIYINQKHWIRLFIDMYLYTLLLLCTISIE